MSATCEWRQHDGVRYLFLCPGGRGAEHLADVLRGAHELMVPEPPGLLRALFDNRPLSGFLPGSAQLGEAKRVQRDVLREHSLRLAVVGVTGVSAAVVRGMSAMSGRVTMLPAPTPESALAFLAREVS